VLTSGHFRRTGTVTDPKRLVQQGYDAIADRYTRWTVSDESDLRATWLAKLAEILAAGSAVLELGCGAGLPVSRALAERYHLTGIDISSVQLDRARINVPNGRFVQADMTEAPFRPAAFDAVVALFSITHVPREEHAELLDRMRGLLRPGGYLLANMASSDDPGTIENDWLGTPMFFSGFDADMNRRLIKEAGFDLIESDVIMHEEDGRPVSFLWVLAQAHDSGEPRGRAAD
jgi:ubiquinone/menaquinone biosynthesis C-methylase UbiE